MLACGFRCPDARTLHWKCVSGHHSLWDGPRQARPPPLPCSLSQEPPHLLGICEKLWARGRWQDSPWARCGQGGSSCLPTPSPVQWLPRGQRTARTTVGRSAWPGPPLLRMCKRPRDPGTGVGTCQCGECCLLPIATERIRGQPRASLPEGWAGPTAWVAMRKPAGQEPHSRLPGCDACMCRCVQACVRVSRCLCAST